MTQRETQSAERIAQSENARDARRTTIPRRILIARLDRLGDVVLSTPVIRHMRKLFPDAYIAFMVRPENKDVVANNPDLNEVILYDKNGNEKSFLGSVFFALNVLRKREFDIAIALHPTNRTHLAFFLAGIPKRIGYDKKMGALLTIRVPHSKQEGAIHEAEYNFTLLKEAGFDVAGADIRPYIVTGKEEKSYADYLEGMAGIGKNKIVLHAGASCPSKRWPAERFARAADILAEKYGSDIVIVGGKDAEKFSKDVISSMKKKAYDLTGRLSIGVLAEILSRARLFVSNDSGPVHVAVAVGTPVIAIFGRKNPGLSPKRWGPLGRKDIVLHKDAGCEICLAHECKKGFRCLEAVTVEDVVRAAGEILGSDPSA